MSKSLYTKDMTSVLLYQGCDSCDELESKMAVYTSKTHHKPGGGGERL